MVERTSRILTLLETMPNSMVSSRVTGPLGGTVFTFTSASDTPNKMFWFKGKGGKGKHTIKRRLRAPNLISPLPRILRLPDTIQPIKRRMVEIKRRIPRAGKGIVLLAPHGKVASGMQEGLRDRAIEFPTVGALFEAVDVVAAEQELDVLGADLVAPEQVDVASQAARIVLKRVVDGIRFAEGGGAFLVRGGEGAVGGEIGG